MATPITEDQAQSAYRVARAVYEGVIAEAAGAAELETIGMNRSSATDYIRNFKQMMVGRQYHRTLNTYSTEYYLDQILAEFGAETATKALAAVRSHLEYYEKLGRGRLLGLSVLCDSFEMKVGRHDDLPSIDKKFEAAVAASLELGPAARSTASSSYPRKPERISVSSVAFVRNPHVVASVLERANGRCEGCGEAAPFNRRATGTPYLEVHHKITLASGGEDTVENAIAMCPNCHRRAHYG